MSDINCSPPAGSELSGRTINAVAVSIRARHGTRTPKYQAFQRACQDGRLQARRLPSGWEILDDDEAVERALGLTPCQVAA